MSFLLFTMLWFLSQISLNYSTHLHVRCTDILCTVRSVPLGLLQQRLSIKLLQSIPSLKYTGQPCNVMSYSMHSLSTCFSFLFVILTVWSCYFCLTLILLYHTILMCLTMCDLLYFLHHSWYKIAPHTSFVPSLLTSQSYHSLHSSFPHLHIWPMFILSCYKIISQHAAADFFHPVVAIYPDIEAAYLAVIKSPMDLSTLANYLQENSLIDEEDYYEKVKWRLLTILCCFTNHFSKFRRSSRFCIK